jgi:hypothetical protein
MPADRPSLDPLRAAHNLRCNSAEAGFEGGFSCLVLIAGFHRFDQSGPAAPEQQRTAL